MKVTNFISIVTVLSQFHDGILLSRSNIRQLNNLIHVCRFKNALRENYFHALYLNCSHAKFSLMSASACVFKDTDKTIFNSIENTRGLQPCLFWSNLWVVNPGYSRLNCFGLLKKNVDLAMLLFKLSTIGKWTLF